jgi:hypothetical protein
MNFSAIYSRRVFYDNGGAPAAQSISRSGPFLRGPSLYRGGSTDQPQHLQITADFWPLRLDRRYSFECVPQCEQVRPSRSIPCMSIFVEVGPVPEGVCRFGIYPELKVRGCKAMSRRPRGVAIPVHRTVTEFPQRVVGRQPDAPRAEHRAFENWLAAEGASSAKIEQSHVKPFPRSDRPPSSRARAALDLDSTEESQRSGSLRVRRTARPLQGLLRWPSIFSCS